MWSGSARAALLLPRVTRSAWRFRAALMCSVLRQMVSETRKKKRWLVMERGRGRGKLAWSAGLLGAEINDCLDAVYLLQEMSVVRRRIVWPGGAEEETFPKESGVWFV